MSTTWIILGGTSTIARGFARVAAERGEGVILAGRDMADMQATATDCGLRGAPLGEAIAFDARDTDSFTPIIERAKALEGSISVAVFVGSMPTQDDIDADPSLIAGTITDSFIGPVTFLTTLAPEMESRGNGCVVGVGSVAGDRGRFRQLCIWCGQSGLSHLSFGPAQPFGSLRCTRRDRQTRHSRYRNDMGLGKAAISCTT